MRMAPSPGLKDASIVRACALRFRHPFCSGLGFCSGFIKAWLRHAFMKCYAKSQTALQKSPVPPGATLRASCAKAPPPGPSRAEARLGPDDGPGGTIALRARAQRWQKKESQSETPNALARQASPLRPSRPRRPRWGLRGSAGLILRGLWAPTACGSGPPGVLDSVAVLLCIGFQAALLQAITCSTVPQGSSRAAVPSLRHCTPGDLSLACTLKTKYTIVRQSCRKI